MEEQRFLPPRETAKVLGVTPLTLRRWARERKIGLVTSPGSHRRYDLCGFLEQHFKPEQSKNNGD